MPKSLRTDITLAFAEDGIAPVLRKEDLGVLENWECKLLILRLMGRKWTEIADPVEFLSVSKSTEVWGACLPHEWYLYYLPALMIVADEGVDPRLENLRDSLCHHLSEGDSISLNAARRREYLRANLSDSQWAVVLQFLNKYSD